MGLALAMAGVSYLVWVLVVGMTRAVVNEVSRTAHIEKIPLEALPTVTRWLWNSFIRAAGVWDVAGVLWLLVSLVLIVGSSRQRWIISWTWLSSICQSMAAALVAVWTALARTVPSADLTPHVGQPPYPVTGWTALSVALAVALLMWVTTLVWLLSERARLGREPSLRDTLRTQVPG